MTQNPDPRAATRYRMRRKPLNLRPYFGDALSFLGGGLMALVAVVVFAGPSEAAGKAKSPPHHHWHFQGVFGTYDKAALQRGYQVYKEVCAACHSMDLVAFRHLGQRGGPFFTEDYPNPIDSPYVKQLAVQFGEDVREVADIDAGGADITRAPGPSDYFPAPYRNENQAKAVNGGAYPPDFSTIVKARHYGADYVRALNLGYVEPPEGLEIPPGKYYNVYYPGDVTDFWSGDPSQVPKGGFIAMAPQLVDGKVTYADGTEATTEQMSNDVTEFLTWVSHPDLEARKNLGRQVLIYLTILAVLLWFSYKQIWRNVKH